MTTALVLYGSTATATTLANACKLSITTGGTTANTTTTCTDGTSSHFWYMEVWSKGGSNGDVSALPAPTGKGYLLDNTSLEGQIISSGNWTTTVRIDDSVGFASVDLIIRAYIYNGGTYTAINTMTAAGVALTSTSTNYTTAASSTAAKTFGTGDKLYIDFWVFANGAGGHWNLDPIRTFTSSNGAAGIANQFVVTTPGYLPAVTTSTRTITSTAALQATNVTRTVTSTAALLQPNTRTAPTTGALQALNTTRSIPNTAALQATNITRTIPSTISLSNTTRVIPATAALQALNITRTVTTSAATILTQNRTVIITAALLQPNKRIVTSTAALLQPNARTTPTTASLLQPNNTRTVLTQAATLLTQNRTVVTSASLLQPNNLRTVPATAALIGSKRTITATAALLQPNTRTVTTSAALLQPNLRTVTATAALLQPNHRTIPATGAISTPALTSGKFTIWANGTGTATFDSFRATQYPDPALSLSPILPRVGATSAAWNALTPTNTTLGIDIGLDGLTWTDVTANNGNPIPGIFSQPDPTIDGFDTDSSANYSNTFRTGGAVATIVHDTANSRMTLTGGTNAIYAYTAIVDNDVDFFVDMDRSDAGGLVWRFVDQSNFYYLQIADSLASVGTPNTITLAKVLANSRTQLATSPISYAIGSPMDAYTVTFTRSTYHRFRVTMLLGVITVYVDGVQLLTYTDGSPLAAGKMGVYSNGGTSRYYQLWMTQIGDVVTGSPAGDIVTGKFVYTRARLATTDASVTPQVLDLTTLGVTPDISMGTLIPNVTYNSSFLNTNFDDLAKQSNFFWYFKPDRSFVFRAMSTIAAPWILQSSVVGLVNVVDLEVSSNLELDVANDLYRNRQTVLGAQDTTSPPAAAFIGDGQSTTFTLGYPLASIPTLTLNGIAQTVGLKGSTGSNWYYAINDPVLEQDSAGVVMSAADQLVCFPWVGLFDIIITVDDTVEQAARALIEGGSGITESVEDHTGENMRANAAITLAAQLINRYAIAGRTLIFDTSRDGLAIGQTLTIFLPEHGLWDAQLIINNIEITLRQGINNTQTYWYKVTASELPHQNTWSKLIAAGLGLS